MFRPLRLLAVSLEFWLMLRGSVCCEQECFEWNACFAAFAHVRHLTQFKILLRNLYARLYGIAVMIAVCKTYSQSNLKRSLKFSPQPVSQ